MGAGLPLTARLAAACLISSGAALAAASDADRIQTFLEAYCTQCHGPQLQMAERRFDQIALPASDPDTAVLLDDIVDQLHLGNMPPAKAPQPSADDRQAAIDALTRTLDLAEAQSRGTGGRTVLRRLNRREYRNTIGSLFAMDMTAFDPTAKFPKDQIADHLDNVGDALVTSGYLLDQYLEAADRIVEKALALREKPEPRTWIFNGNFKQQPELDYPHREVFNYRYMILYESLQGVRHEGAYGALRDLVGGVPAEGSYEIRVLAEPLNRIHPYDSKIFGMDPEEPFRLGVVPGDEKAGMLHGPQPIEPLLAEAALSEGEPQWTTFRVWLNQGQTPRLTFPNGMIDSRGAFNKIINNYQELLPEAERQGPLGIFKARPAVLRFGKMPQIRIHEVRLTGPLYEEWPPQGQRLILGEEPFRPERTRTILERFASRAYRRPARPDEVDRLAAVVGRRMAEGKPAFEAMKDGLKAALCSPGFLYLAESDVSGGDALPAYALASRLSYFLWATMPDDELLTLAASGKLLEPQTLAAQARRMLADPRSDAFVEGFLDSWLNLRSLGDMPPDCDMFKEYYAKDLQAAMLRETRMFTRSLLDSNGDVGDFLVADYTFVNKPLAALYGLDVEIPAAAAHEFRRVKLEDRRRGGLLGQGSVLTVTANGIETSPVTRGVWVLENLLGTPPAPPPDDVPVIDPDVRGATSMRDLLTKHRENPSCYSCHQKIDPPGFALESFDPIGAWRSEYPTGAAIDASGEFPDGAAFDDVAGLKHILLDRKEQFARTLTERLVSYATGRRAEAADRRDRDRITKELAARGHGLRDLVELVASSAAFRAR